MIELTKHQAEDLLFFRVKTTRATEKLERGSLESLLFEERKGKDFGAMSSMDLNLLYKQKAPIHPIHNKIVCISLGFFQDGEFKTYEIKGDERKIVGTFYNQVENSGLKLTGFNVINFDLPIIRMKAMKYGITVPNKVSDVFKKPWLMDNVVLDLAVAFKGTFFHSFGFNDTLHFFDLPIIQDDDKDFYEDGEEEFLRTCASESNSLLMLFQKMCGRPLFGKKPKQKEIKTPVNFDTLVNTENIPKEFQVGGDDGKDSVILKAALYKPFDKKADRVRKDKLVENHLEKQ